jgi:phosphinothricin acetyltransferase
MPQHLRLATLRDTEQILAIYSPYCFTPISFESEPPGIAEMRQRIAKTLEYYPWLVCEHDGEISGYVYASRHRERPAYRWSVDTTVYIHPQCQRLGIGRALYSSLFRLLVLQGYVNAYAGVALPNPASVGLHTAMGFQLVGTYHQVGFKCGAWHDVAWFERPLQSRPSPPSPPKTLVDVQTTDAWTTAVNAGLPLLRLD